MNRDLVDLYSDYLLSSFGATTATGLSELLEGTLSHDQITRFLAQQRFDSKTLWQLVKPMVRAIEDDAGVLTMCCLHPPCRASGICSFTIGVRAIQNCFGACSALL